MRNRETIQQNDDKVDKKGYEWINERTSKGQERSGRLGGRFRDS